MGRPSLLSEEGEQELLDWINGEIVNGRNVDYERFHNKVSTFFLDFLSIIHLKARDIWVNIPGRNLVVVAPRFSRAFMYRFTEKYRLKYRTARLIEEV